MSGHHFLPSHYLWSLNCVVFAQACQTQSVWLANGNATYPWITLFGAMPCGGICDQRSRWLKSFVISYSKAWNVRPRSQNRGTHVGIVMSAHAFSVFQCLHWIFWMRMSKVFRWNGLEILIPKHMWKSKIGPLEQIQAKNRYITFFFHPVHFRAFKPSYTFSSI